MSEHLYLRCASEGLRSEVEGAAHVQVGRRAS
jgi:hypothetical protein